jgi:hypothetical protein
MSRLIALEGPCTACQWKGGCTAYQSLKSELFGKAGYKKPIPLDAVDLALDSFMKQFIASVRALKAHGSKQFKWESYCLSAAYDLAATAIYSNALIGKDLEFTQKAIRSSSDVAFFPYTWMCPLRVSQGKPPSECYLPSAKKVDDRYYPIPDMIAKPGGRMIGDVGIKVLKSIFRQILAEEKPHAKMRDGGGVRGEFDLTIVDDENLIFVEVKAKPLVSYPLKVVLASMQSSSSLAWIDVPRSEIKDLSVFLGATNFEIPVDIPSLADSETWPLLNFTAFISDPEKCEKVIENWSKHLAGYRQWDNEDGTTRWIRFGCGNFSAIENGKRIELRVANTKELPGLDRTDDIKKGAAQMLKFARFKFDCPQGAVSCVLAGNTWAETHSEHYIEPLVSLKIRRGDVEASGEEWIFDAIVGLTRNWFNRPELSGYFTLPDLKGSLEAKVGSDTDREFLGDEGLYGPDS